MALGHAQSVNLYVVPTAKIAPNDLHRKRRICAIKMASTSGSRNYELGKLDRPKWSGQTTLSRIVGAIIAFKPLYSLLKLGARQLLISTAEKNNVPWRKMTKEILESDVYNEFDSVRNPGIVYPDYYLSPFHAYDEGNLTWLAAAEAEAATMSMELRAIPTAATLKEANEQVRGNWLRTIETHHTQYSSSPVIDIIDIGCSVGVSTRHLADFYPSSQVTGLDLSPYFLSVAKLKEKKLGSRERPINWVHANGEDTSLPSQSFDLVSISAVLHECPERAIINLVKESFSLLRGGGTIAIMDQSPKSKILQELPPALFTLLKSTEPFLDEYHLTDLEGRLKEAGFVNVTTKLTDPRHMTTTATKPL